VGHLQSKGFKVKTNNVSDNKLNALKRELGVPPRLASCHTGMIGKYIIEGHVPGDVILKFLKEESQLAGLGVPGMPHGSPGMENNRPQSYTVFSFDKNGSVAPYQQVNP
jgi:hypothetical protein